MNCKVNVDITSQGQIEILPLSMSKVLEVEGSGLVKKSFTANFTECYDKGYTKLKKYEGKIHGF